MQKKMRWPIFGFALAIWRPAWELASHWSSADFVLQKAKQYSVLSFLLGPVGGNLMLILGLGIIGISISRVVQRIDNIESDGLTPLPDLVPANDNVAKESLKIACIATGFLRVSPSRSRRFWMIGRSHEAAVAKFKNVGTELVRGVAVSGTFYSERGTKLSETAFLWLDEEHDAVGFMPGQERIAVVAVRARGELVFGTSELFGFLRDKLRDKLRDRSVSASLYISGQGDYRSLRSHSLLLQIDPSLSFTLEASKGGPSTT